MGISPFAALEKLMARPLILLGYLALLYAAGMGTAHILHALEPELMQPFATISGALP